MLDLYNEGRPITWFALFVLTKGKERFSGGLGDDREETGEGNTINDFMLLGKILRNRVRNKS